MRHAIGPYEDLTTTVTKTQIEMVWTHNKINRTCKYDPTIQGTLRGGRRKGRQKKRWEDSISEWTGLGLLGEALRKAKDREEWRKVVTRSSLMPQRSFRLLNEGVSENLDLSCINFTSLHLPITV